MSQSLSHVILHVVFSTKNRFPFIDKPISDPLHAYLATVCRNEGCHAYRVGGIADHVHIATTLSRTITIAKLVENIKKVSSLWIKERDVKYRQFSWQRGYGAFSVGPQELDAVVQYINRQPEHHKVVTFQEEYRAFLEKYHVQYDERYVLD
jgi:REP-associated tyrosine transposase